MPKPLSVLEVAKLYVRHRKESTREAIKRCGKRVRKGDMIPWLINHLDRPWAHRCAFFPVIDDWYPCWEFPEGNFIRVHIDPVGTYVNVILTGADDHALYCSFSSLIEAEAFWDALVAEPELCHTMISLLYEPFSPY
jgi:hypothetical protein